MAHLISCLVFSSNESRPSRSRVLREVEQFSFNGAIWVDPTAKGCKGRVFDHNGVADLEDILIPMLHGEAPTLTFIKRPEGRGQREHIRFAFKNAGGDLWIGKYEGRSNGNPVTGDARCYLTEVPDEYFDGEKAFTRDSERPFGGRNTPAVL